MRRIIYVLRSIWREDSNRGQRLRRVLFFFGWQMWKRMVGSPLNARLSNGLRIRVWRDCDSSPAAFYYSLPNSVHLALVRQYLHGGTFVDVGANVASGLTCLSERNCQRIWNLGLTQIGRLEVWPNRSLLCCGRQNINPLLTRAMEG